MKKKLLTAFLLASICCYSQLSENFSDGKFTGIPTQNRAINWTGEVEKFIVNPDFQLQLNAAKETGTAQLRTISNQGLNSYWEFWMKMGFNPTSSNYAKVYLYSDKEDLLSELNGLFVRLGHTNKNLCLVSKTGATEKVLVTGTAKRLDLASVSLQVKVTLDQQKKLSLYSKLDSETDFILEGEYTLAETPKPSFFGLVCYYTSTRSNAFYFDNFMARELKKEESGGGDEPLESPDSLDLVINEILYDPSTGGEEYIELYNRSKKSINMQQLSVATRKTDGSLSTQYALAKAPTILFPEEYLVVTKSRSAVCSIYQCKETSIFAELTTTPALNNTGACIVLLNNQNGKIVDEFCYTDKMHAEGISNKKGVSLERLDTEKPTNDLTNWHSASAETNYGTPGYKNSQYTPGNTETGNEITVSLPDGMSGNDYKINYRFSTPGNRANAYLYDTMGRLVRVLANNQILGTEGFLSWDGQGRSSQNVRMGIYILYMEVYNMKGQVQKYKMPIVKR